MPKHFCHLDFRHSFGIWALKFELLLQSLFFVFFGKLFINPRALGYPVCLVVTDFPFDYSGHADDKGFLRNYCFFLHHATGGDDTTIAAFDIVEDDRPDGYQYVITDFAAVADGAVAENNVIADSSIHCWRQRGRPRMYHAVILDNHIIADGYFTQVAPDHRSRPDAGVLAYFDIADNISRLADKGGLGNLRRFPVKALNHAFLRSFYSMMISRLSSRDKASGKENRVLFRILVFLSIQ